MIARPSTTARTQGSFAMRRIIRRRLVGVPALAAVILCTSLAGTAVAAGSRISRIGVPAHAKVNRRFSITVKGHAAHKVTMYVFFDALACKGNPAAEFNRRAYGLFGPVQKGDFNLLVRPSAKLPNRAIRIHVCVYLVAASAPKNPRSGVLAHRYASFRVHR
jgi:hypothetical protein